MAAAVVSLRVYTGTSATSESAAVTGIDFVSTDNSTNSLSNRTQFPVVTGLNSYSKHLRLKIDSAPSNRIENVKFWTDGTPTSNVALVVKLGVGAGGATPGTGDSTPTASALSGATDAYSYTSSSKGTWDSGQYSTLNNVTKSLVLQLQPGASATPGNWSETLSYSYDEL